MATLRRLAVLPSVAATLLSSSAPAVAGTEPDDDLGDLADALAADAAEATPASPVPGVLGSLNPDISFIVDVTLAWFTDDDNLQTGGHDPVANGFNLQQIEMAIGKAVDPYFRVDGSLVFGPEGVEVEEFYASTLALPHNLQARIGEFFTRFGRHNAKHPHAWAFVDQPIVLGRYFGGDGNHGLGAELSYLTPLPWYVELVASVTNPAGDETARNFYGDAELPLDTPLDFQSTAAIKQFFALGDNWSLMVGTSLATGPNSTGDDRRTHIAGADVYLKYRPVDRASHTVVELQSEWMHRRRQIPGDRIWDHGGYAYATWQWAKRWSAGARYEYGQAARGAGGNGAGDDLDPEWTDGRHRTSAALTFRPTEYSRIRAQASLDQPGWRDDAIVAGFLAFEFNIGAHGAHAF